MASTKKHKGILLISRDKLDCFITVLPATLSLTFPPTTMKNMDIVDRNAFITYVQTFIQTNKLPPTAFSLIFHENILFEKLFPREAIVQAQQPAVVPSQSQSVTPPSSQQGHVQPSTKLTGQVHRIAQENKLSEEKKREEEEEKIEQFVESVPFEETLVKTVKSPQGTLAIVANKDLAVALKDAFEKMGHTIESVLPVTVLGNEFNLANGLTPDAARAVIPKLETIKSQSMLIEEQSTSPVGPVAMGMPQRESEKRRLFLMIGVFGLLLIIMVVLFIRMNAENAAIRERAAQPVPVQPTATPSATPIPSPTVVIASTSAAYKQTLPIQITMQPVNASQAATLQSQLRAIGYQAVQLQQGAVSAQALVTFLGSIPEDVKEEVLQAVVAIDSTAAVQQNQTAELRILISL